MRTMRTISLAIAAFWAGSVTAGELRATMFKMPYCDCCEGHADHLRANGFSVEIQEVPDLTPIRQAEGVPPALEGCHTLLIDGLVVEGHVSAPSIKRLLSERPKGVKGIAMPGMPTGVPGMPGPKEEPIEVFAFGSAGQSVFVVE